MAITIGPGINIGGGIAITAAAANSGIGYGLMTRWDPGGLWGGRLAILNLYNTDIGAGGVTTSWNTNKTRFGL